MVDSHKKIDFFWCMKVNFVATELVTIEIFFGIHLKP